MTQLTFLQVVCVLAWRASKGWREERCNHALALLLPPPLQSVSKCFSVGGHMAKLCLVNTHQQGFTFVLKALLWRCSQWVADEVSCVCKDYRCTCVSAMLDSGICCRSWHLVKETNIVYLTLSVTKWPLSTAPPAGKMKCMYMFCVFFFSTSVNNYRSGVTNY